MLAFVCRGGQLWDEVYRDVRSSTWALVTSIHVICLELDTISELKRAVLRGTDTSYTLTVFPFFCCGSSARL